MQAGADDNVVIGTSAGTSLTTGERNVFIGESAGKDNNGLYNTFIGRRAGYENTSNYSVAIGYNTLYNGGGGASTNIAIGANAMLGVSGHGGDFNIAIGYNSLYSIDGGRYNITLGYEAGENIAAGNDNLFIGRRAGRSVTSGTGNIIIGSGSLGEAALANQLRIGNSNNFTLISGSLTDGGLLIQGQVSASSYIGDGSGLTGISTTPFPFTGDAQITGSLVISASNNTSESLSIQGSGSTIFSIQGSQGQLFSVTDDLLDEVFSVADISGDTLLSVSGSGLVTIPVGDLTGSATATASYGAFKGDGSQLTNLPASDAFPFTGDAQITGSLEISGSLKMIRPNNKLDLSIGSNIIIGREAGNSISDNRNAIFLGYKAGYTNTSPNANIAIGYGAGGSLGTNASQQNIFMGYLAGAGNTSIGSITSRMSEASNNIGMGYQALLYLTSGDQNVALGSNVMRNISTGGNNIALGAVALYNTDSGDNNIGIGYYAGSNQTSGDGNITIGSGSLGIAGESNQLRIGQGNGDALIHGDFDSGSITFNVSGSDAFQVVGSEGTIFKLEDDLDGTLFTVNDRSGIPMFEVSASGRIVAEEGESIIRSQRPMVTHTADFSITSSLDYAGKYHIVGGDLTCSINTGSIVPAGAEFEFFQTSSANNFLFITGSPHVDLIAKNDNRNLAGRGSGATLKYIGGSTFHLVGDLT
jgi:hypothetical protein